MCPRSRPLDAVAIYSDPRGCARKLGNVIADLFKRKNPDAIEEQVEIEQERPTRAPVAIAVVSHVQREQNSGGSRFFVGAAARLLIAAQSMGYAAQWLTEWYAYDASVKQAIGAGPEGEIAGFLY